MTSPIEELRQAVETLRERADQAPPGPWKVVLTDDDELAYIEVTEDAISEGRSCGCCSVGDLSPETARWMVTVSPDLAEPMAEIIESTIYAIENSRCDADRLAPVLRLARQINKAHRDA